MPDLRTRTTYRVVDAQGNTVTSGHVVVLTDDHGRNRAVFGDTLVTLTPDQSLVIDWPDPVQARVADEAALPAADPRRLRRASPLALRACATRIRQLPGFGPAHVLADAVTETERVADILTDYLRDRAE